MGASRFVSRPQAGVRRAVPITERPIHDRVLFLMVVFLPFAVGWWLTLRSFLLHPHRVPYVDAAWLPLVVGFLTAQIGVTFVLAGLAGWYRRRGSGGDWLAHATCQWFAVGTAVVYFFVGPLTSTFSIFALAMPIMGLLLFGRRPTFGAIATCSVLYVPVFLLQMAGEIPYAPLLLETPIAAQLIDPYWAAFNAVPWMALTIACVGGFLQVQRQLEHREVQLAQLADTDALTGLANRRHVVRVLEQLLGEPPSRAPTVVLLFDADFFKRVNDAWGHAVGDDVLRHAAAALRLAGPPGGAVARIGGEEFVVIGTPPRRADVRDAGGLEAWGDALRIACQREIVERLRRDDLPPIAFTWSVGATRLREDDTVESVLHRADMSLLDAKMRRDCLVWDEGESEDYADSGAPPTAHDPSSEQA